MAFEPAPVPPTFAEQLAALDARAVAQGTSVCELLAVVAKNALGVDIREQPASAD